MLIETQLLHTE